MSDKILEYICRLGTRISNIENNVECGDATEIERDAVVSQLRCVHNELIALLGEWFATHRTV